MQPMESTANSPLPPDSRTPPESPPPAAVPPAHGPVDTLSSWDGQGTSYTIVPRPVVQAPAALEPARRAGSEATEDALPPAAIIAPAAEVHALAPAPRRSANWQLIGGAVVGTLVTALLIKLWTSPADDSAAQDPAVSHANVSTYSEAVHSPRPASQSSDTPADHAQTLTQEPMDEAPLVIPTPERVPEEFPAPAAPEHPLAPETDITLQAPTVQQNVELPAVSPTPAAASAHAPALTSKPAEHKQPAPAAPAITAQKLRPVPTDAVIITGTKPASPVKPRSAPAPAAVGTLTVTVQPWAEVWIDGRKRGISPPPFKLQLPPGIYTVELRNPDLPSYSQKVQIAAGQSVTLRHSFQ